MRSPTRGKDRFLDELFTRADFLYALWHADEDFHALLVKGPHDVVVGPDRRISAIMVSDEAGAEKLRKIFGSVSNAPKAVM